MRTQRVVTGQKPSLSTCRAPRPCRWRVQVLAAIKASTATRKYTLTPSVSYSVSKADISVQELRLLYSSVHARHGVSGSTTQQSFFRHWAQLSDGEADSKLQLLLDKSVAIVAAYSRDSSIHSDGTSSDPSTSGTGTQHAPGASADSSWMSWGWRKPRRLVGFARAAGDSSLVATIHDVLVHPDLQGYGLGSVLIRRLLNQVANQGVFDVGLVTPSQLQSFFHSCSFELDREESVPMALGPYWSKDEYSINAPLQSNRALQQLLEASIDQRLLAGARLDSSRCIR